MLENALPHIAGQNEPVVGVRRQLGAQPRQSSAVYLITAGDDEPDRGVNVDHGGKATFHRGRCRSPVLLHDVCAIGRETPAEQAILLGRRLTRRTQCLTQRTTWNGQ